MARLDRAPGSMRTLAGTLLAGALLAGCAAIPQDLPFGDLAGTTPKAVIGRVISAEAAGDLASARSIACAQPMEGDGMPVPIPIRFGMSGAPSLGDDAVLGTLRMDLSGLVATERLLDQDNATVEVRGPVVLHYDLNKVRAVVTDEAGATAAETALAVLGDGTVTTTLDRSLSLTRVDGRWQLCMPGEDVGLVGG